MSRYSRQFSWWLAIFLWLAVIYFFSDQPSLKSSLAPWLDLILRKIAHLAEYFVLAFLFFRAFRSGRLFFAEALAMSLIGVIMAASFDEWHQSFIVGRQASIIDVGVDSLGSIFFIFLQYFDKSK